MTHYNFSKEAQRQVVPSKQQQKGVQINKNCAPKKKDRGTQTPLSFDKRAGNQKPAQQNKTAGVQKAPTTKQKGVQVNKTSTPKKKSKGRLCPGDFSTIERDGQTYLIRVLEIIK